MDSVNNELGPGTGTIDLEPSLKWLTMDTANLLNAMEKYEISGHEFESLQKVKTFHNVLLNLMVKDDPRIHVRVRESPKGKYQSLVVECLKKLYDGIKPQDFLFRNQLLQSQWIRSVLKPKADAWDNAVERLQFMELPFFECADMILKQDVPNKHLDNFFPQLGRDILEWYNNGKLNVPNLEEKKLSLIYSICKSISTTSAKDSFTQQELYHLRKIFVTNHGFKRPPNELFLEASKKLRSEGYKS